VNDLEISRGIPYHSCKGYLRVLVTEWRTARNGKRTSPVAISHKLIKTGMQIMPILWAFEPPEKLAGPCFDVEGRSLG